jgi:hypothetical protein
MARPTLYKESYCKKVIQWGKEGKFPVKWASELGIGKQTLLDWRQANPEFKEAYDIAKAHVESHVTDKAFDGDVLDLNKGKFFLSACFGVSETNKQQIQAEVSTAPELKIDFGDRE